MDRRVGIIIVTAAIQLALGPAASGQTAYGEIETPATVGMEDADRDAGGFGLHFQLGAAYRLAANVRHETKEKYLFTADLAALEWSRTESTWGLGGHFAVDDDGHRVGLKGLWRTPLKSGTWSYFQLSPGIYLSATDNHLEPRFPGFFLEAELGFSRLFALVLGGEARPYDALADRYGSPFDRHAAVKQSGTATALYVGGKGGQEGALVVGALGLLALLAAGAAMASGGGFY
jgi:hypothetical protein